MYKLLSAGTPAAGEGTPAQLLAARLHLPAHSNHRWFTGRSGAIMTTSYGHIAELLMNIPAAIFKAECLQLMDEVARTGKPIIITKHGKAVAQLVPIPVRPESQFGYLKNTVKIYKDIVAPIEVSWDALSTESRGGSTAIPHARRHRLKPKP